MSLITQCPACATMFKVVPDQLRISDGWVRCGQCDEVFDANAYLYTEPGASSEVETASSEVPASMDGTWVAPSESNAVSDTDGPDVAATAESFDDTPAVATELDEIDLDVAIDIPAAQVPEVQSLDRVMDLSPGLPPDSIPQPEEMSEAVVPSAPVPRYAQAQVKPSTNADPRKLSFMRQARKRSLWQHIAVRLSLGVLSLVLMGALALQIVVLERDQIAATEPDSRAPLDALCEVVGCQIQPLRKIDAVVIDSSAFTKVQGDVYRLNFTLKSTSAVSLAMPALELTLTDMQDQAVLRRVVQAKELSASKTVIEPGSEISVILPLRVKTGADEPRVSGYRLLAFYP
jgi:predicted Zn finger-like uncharacterized protein